MQRTLTILTLILGCAAARASAQDSSADATRANPARLEYSAPDMGGRCPTRESFEDIVAARLGYGAFADDGERLVTAHIEDAGTELRAHVEVRSRSGEVEGTRDFDGGANECSDIVQAMAVTIAVTIDPSSLTGPVPPPEPEPAAVVGPAPPVVTSPPSEAWHAGFYLDAALNLMSTPGVALGPRLGVGLSRRSFSIAVEGEMDRQLGYAQSDASDRIAAHVYTGAVVPCLIKSVVQACVVARFGAFVGESQNLDNATIVTRFWSSAGGRLGLQLPVTDFFSLRMNADFAFLISRTDLTVDGASVWQAPIFTVGVGIGAVLNFF